MPRRSAKPSPSPSPLKVLFIGNSFTARNDLPGLVERLANAAGLGMEHQLISAGGASLRRHWNAGEARAAIERGKFDAVVLQEQSTLPIKNAQRFHENVRLFDAAIRASGATTVLYMTWARKHAPETQKLLTDAYRSIGAELEAKVIPAGEAWRALLATHDRPALHDADGSHPTLAGSFLAACAAFAVLFDRSPVGLDIDLPELSAADTKALASLAAITTA